MKPERRPWGLRDWVLFLTLVTLAFSVLATMLSAFRRGGDAVNLYVDTRARYVAGGVVHDSLSTHRHDEHRRHRR